MLRHLARYSAVWCGVVRRGAVRCGAVGRVAHALRCACATMRYSAVLLRYGEVPSAVWYGTLSSGVSLRWCRGVAWCGGVGCGVVWFGAALLFFQALLCSRDPHTHPHTHASQSLGNSHGMIPARKPSSQMFSPQAIALRRAIRIANRSSGSLRCPALCFGFCFQYIYTLFVFIRFSTPTTENFRGPSPSLRPSRSECWQLEGEKGVVMNRPRHLPRR